jgi:hypothetical protein
MRPQSAPKKFVTLNGLSEVDIGLGPLSRAYTGGPLRQNLYGYQRPFWDDSKVTAAGHFVVPEIIVTPMNVTGVEIVSSDINPEKSFRRINYVAGHGNSPNSPPFKIGPTAGGTKVQKVGGGGYISSACRKAPRPQSLFPSLPSPPSLNCSDVAFVSGVHFSAQQRIKLDRKSEELGKVETKK